MLKLNIIIVIVLLLSACAADKEAIDADYKGWTPQQFYNQAKLEIAGGEVEKASDLFERLRANYPASKYSHQSRLDLGYAWYDSGEYDLAMQTFNRYLELYPQNEHTDYVYYMRGVISEEKSDSILDNLFVDKAQKNITGLQQALNYYSQLVKEFPQSKYSKEALKRLPELQEYLARYELLVAKFYYGKKSYIASVNRLQYLLEKFPNTNATPVALTLLAKSYEKLNLPTKQADVIRIFTSSYQNLEIDLKKELDLDESN